MTKTDAIHALEKMNLPIQMKLAAAAALAFMDDKSVGSIFGMAQNALTEFQAGNRAGAVKILTDGGLPGELVNTILDKVKPDDSVNPNG